ncbi:MAG: hypothetical protein IKK25_02510 [Lentisphaeria bacterium]|nr:hypothetical protein [Lentisphaeria bacterium]
MKHFVSCTPLACQAHKKYEAHFVLASFARQASKYMKRHCVHEAKPFQASFTIFAAGKNGGPVET